MGIREAVANLIFGPPLPTEQRAAEGEYRGGPYYLPWSGGWLPAEAGQNLNWWQIGYSLRGSAPTAMVEACIGAYSQTVAMCPGNHWLLQENGGRKRQKNSALTRFLRQPNAYQSISDFFLNAVRELYAEGAFYALAQRNARGEITALHPMRSRMSQPLVAVTGDVFYYLAGNEIVDRMLGMPGGVRVPARDVLHIRLHTPEHPLIGVTPITATAIQIAASNAALAQQINFFTNQSRPSYVLSTDQILSRPQVEELRERWDQQSKGLNAGGAPILTAGLKPSPIGVNAQDAQLIELLKLSDTAVAQVFRIPLVLVGIDKTPFASTESLMNFWLASGLGFVLNHIEEAMGLMFGLAGQPDEYLELDTQALQRSNFRERVEAYVRSSQGGIHSPDEARNEFELPVVPGGFGKEPRVQQQVVPLSAWEKTPPKPAFTPGAAPPAAAHDGQPPKPQDGQPPKPPAAPAGPPSGGRTLTSAQVSKNELDAIYRTFALADTPDV